MVYVNFKTNTIELVIDSETGETFASVSAVARMTGKDRSLINRYVNGQLKKFSKMELINAGIRTNNGIKYVNLLNEDQMIEVIFRYKPELVKELAKVGIRELIKQKKVK
jgi:hypothetical protein